MENLTPITRKETFLAKAAGQDVETPTPVTREEVFLDAIAKGGGGGSSNLFIVTANGTVSVNKTFNEIVAAYEAGKSVYLVKSGETYILSNVTSAAVDFVNITNGGTPVTYRISSSNGKFSKEYSLLPKSAAADNGSEAIVKNGAWTMQKKKFIVTLTPTSPDYSGTMDKTVAEMTEAYNAGMQIVWRVIMASNQYIDVNVTAVMTETDSDYPSFNAYVIEIGSGVLVYAYTPATIDGTKQTYYTLIYSLTLAS